MPLLQRSDRIRDRFILALENAYVDSLRREGLHGEAEHADAAFIADGQQERERSVSILQDSHVKTPHDFFANGVMAAPEDSPNSGQRSHGEQQWVGNATERKARSEERHKYAKKNGEKLGFSSPERRQKTANLDTAHSPYDYQESVRGR